MSRRRLRLNWSSDEEREPEVEANVEPEIEEDPEEEPENEDFHHPHSSSLHNHPISNFNPNISEPLQISDDDEQHFIDVSDHLSPPSLDSDHSPHRSPDLNPPSSGIPSIEPSGCPVNDFLRSLGLSLKREWLDACLHALEISIPGFSTLNPSAKGKLCFEQFLVSDMNYSGAGILPVNVDSMHLVQLPGPYVLQVDEIVNISCPLKGRYQTAPAGIKRCLKLSMTDGVQRIFGMEYRPIKDLEVLAPAGIKVVICNATVRHGLLMLVPEALEVLGGLVEGLDAARQRLVEEVNKPPRGRRTRTGVVPSLASRATLAAWPSNDVHEPGYSNASVGNELSLSNQGNGTIRRGNEAFTVPVGRADVDYQPSSNFDSSVEEIHTHTIPVGRANVDSVSSVEEMHTHSIPVGRANGASELCPNFVSSVEEIHTHSIPVGRATVDAELSPHFVSSVEDIHTHFFPTSRASTEPNISFDSVSTVEDSDMVDMEHPFMPSGEQAIPFTYLASLSTKWATMEEKSSSVHGKIKCILTGLKGFQFNRRTTYELRAYIDDGSLISEVLIDHQVVQKLIGHPPNDVTAALASSDIKVVSDMKETMRRFQVFLANFEGTMLIERNRTSPLPLVLDMNLGCLESDAQLLLKRLKCSIAAQTEEHTHLDPDVPLDGW